LNRQLQAQNSEYKIENALLQTRLAAELESNKAINDVDSSAPRLPATEDDDSSLATPTLADKYYHLARKHAHDMQMYERAQATLVKKNHFLKDNAKEWKVWGEKRKEMYEQRGVKIRTLQAKLRDLTGEDIRELTSEFGHSRPSTARSSCVGKPSPPNLPSSAVVTPKAGLQPAAKSILGSKDGAMGSEKALHGSQTTSSCETDQPSSPLQETTHNPLVLDEDERVVIVSEACRKRKRDASGEDVGAFQSCTDKKGSPEKPVWIKEERYSSPVGSPTRRAFPRTETLDLDEIGDRIDTPRKRRRLELLHRASSLRAGVMDESRHERSTSEPLECQLSERDFSDENIDPTFTPELARGSRNPFPLFDDKALSEPSHSFVLKKEIKEEPTPSRSQLRALNTRSTNQRVLPRTDDPNGVKGRKRDLESGAKAIHVLAEDGNHLPKPSRVLSPASRKRAGMRLEDLLDRPTPTKQPLVVDPQPSRILRKDGLELATPLAPISLRSIDTPTSGMLPSPTSLLPTKAAPTFRMPRPLSASKYTTPRVKPLRDRPMTALRADDFKLNPRIFRDLDTTAEPVRGREARRHQMTGCKDPTCATCGGQLKFLATGLPITVGSTLFASTQDDELTEDEKLIKYYLGANFNQARVARMDSDERESLIIKAKEQIISERHIRHRIKPNQRAKSPPGFWNVDMPSTQEIEEQREEADRREKVEVAERYREAMRDGGKWIFKDE
jgi:hypothetical protein